MIIRLSISPQPRFLIKILWGFTGNSIKVPGVEPFVEQQSAAVTSHAVHGPPALEQPSPPGEEKGVYEAISLSEVGGK